MYQICRAEQETVIRWDAEDKTAYIDTANPATECAKMLGYKEAQSAVRQHCRYCVKHTAPHPQNPTKTIEMNFIPEGDLYRLITHSKLPAAERFERWVFDEVLPTIRKLDALVAAHPDAYRCTRSDEHYHAKRYEVDSKFIRFGKPASEAQKEAMRVNISKTHSKP